MIKRETVLAHKRAAKKFDYHPDKRTIDMLADACLELLDKHDGGLEQAAWAQNRRVQDKQVKLALDTVRALVRKGEMERAVYACECAQEMLSSKLLWRQEWAFYLPRISEEFDTAKGDSIANH